MIILDTNVLSEPMKAAGSAAVAAWLDSQDAATLFVTTITLAELWLGLEMLPLGRRRSSLATRLAEVVNTFNGAHVLPFDTEAARYYGVLVARARHAGCAISVADGQIAAIARAHGFAVATRDTAPFVAAGVPVIDPWGQIMSAERSAS